MDDRALIPLEPTTWASAAVEDMSHEERATSYAVLNYLCKKLEARKDELREHLLGEARNNGEVGKTGTTKLDFGDTTVQAVRIAAKEPPFAALHDLLGRRGVSLGEAYDRVETWVFNPSKLSRLISLGFITQDEVDEICSDSYNLRVTPSKDLGAQLKTAGEQIFGPEKPKIKSK